MERPPIDYAHIVPEALRAMIGLEQVVRASGLEPLLLETGQGAGLADQWLCTMPRDAHEGRPRAR